MLLRGILLTSVKQKVTEAGKEGVYSSALYLPLLYLVTATPTLLLLSGLGLLLTVVVARFFPDMLFPTDFVLVMATVTTLMSAVLYLAFRLLLRKLIAKEKSQVVTNPIINIEEKIQGAFAPFLIQLKEEQNLFKNSNFRSPK